LYLHKEYPCFNKLFLRFIKLKQRFVGNRLLFVLRKLGFYIFINLQFSKKIFVNIPQLQNNVLIQNNQLNDLEIPNNNTFPPCDIIGDIDHPIIVYPNPTNDNWNIKINATNKEEVLVTLKDNSGKIVYSKTIILNNIGENEFTINSNNLLKGAYLLEIKGKSIDMNRKLIKM
jgi:hypothetical protein